jgi:hypothetical protein
VNFHVADAGTSLKQVSKKIGFQDIHHFLKRKPSLSNLHDILFENLLAKRMQSDVAITKAGFETINL